MKKVKPENECDVCKKKLAKYYNIVYYVHVCSEECWKLFLERYNIEIDEIALELKNANDLFGEKDAE